MSRGDSGDPHAVTAAALRKMPLPQPGSDDDKNQRGRVLVVAGSVEVPGAALLAGVGVLRAGAGRLQIATCRSVALALGLAVPEALVVGLPETPAGGIDPSAAEALSARAAQCKAVLVGPGMMDADAVDALTAELLLMPEGPALVLDARAIVRLSGVRDRMRRHGARAVITPHSGEMAGLLGISREAVEDDPLAAAHRAAAELAVVVALKGGRTTIVSPEGAAWTYSEGQVGLATSGSGDTLAGIVAGLLARGAEPLQAAIWGVYLHGESGNRLASRIGPLGFLARELLAEIPGLLRDLGADGPAGT